MKLIWTDEGWEDLLSGKQKIKKSLKKLIIY